MKRWLRILCVILILAMAMTVIGCGEDDPKDKNDYSGDNPNGAPDEQGTLPDGTPSTTPLIPVAYSDMRPSLYSSGHDGMQLLIRSEYAADGKLLREHLLEADYYYLPIGCVNYTYNGNQLVRSTMYLAENDNEIFLQKFSEQSYITYTYDASGNAVAGVMYEDGKPNGTTATVAYHDNGVPKKISYSENGKVTYAVENDAAGRRIYEKCVEYDAEMTLRYQGDSRQIASAVSTDLSDRDKVCNWNLQYDEGGNITRISEASNSEMSISFTYASAQAGAKMTKLSSPLGGGEFAYTEKGFLSEIVTRDDDMVSTMKIEYTAADLVKKTVSTDSDGESYAKEYEYNGSGLMTKETARLLEADGTLEFEDVTAYTYNAAGKVITELRTEKRKAEEHDQVAGDYYTHTYKTEYTYDSSNVLSKEVYTQTAPNGERHVTTNFYDTSGNVLREEFEAYDKNGNLVNQETHYPSQDGVQTKEPDHSYNEAVTAPSWNEMTADTQKEATTDGSGENGGANPPDDPGNGTAKPNPGGNDGGGDKITMPPVETVYTMHPNIDADGDGIPDMAVSMNPNDPSVSWLPSGTGLGDFAGTGPDLPDPGDTTALNTEDPDAGEWISTPPTTKKP